jgi:hypothetical protein
MSNNGAIIGAVIDDQNTYGTASGAAPPAGDFGGCFFNTPVPLL